MLIVSGNVPISNFQIGNILRQCFASFLWDFSFPNLVGTKTHRAQSNSPTRLQLLHIKWNEEARNLTLHPLNRHVVLRESGAHFQRRFGILIFLAVGIGTV